MTLPNSTPSTLPELARSISIHISGTSKYRRFQRLYGSDRIAFVHDCMPKYSKTLTPYQEEILGLFDEGHTRVAVRSPHGSGKTFIASILTHHGVLTAEEDAKVPTTASAWRQLEKYLWPEIKKTNKEIDWHKVGRPPYDENQELMILSIRLKGGTVEAFAVASDDHNTIEGAHATRIIYIFDEAKTIPRATWNAAEGAFSTEGLGNKPLGDVELALLQDQPGLTIVDIERVEEILANTGSIKEATSYLQHVHVSTSPYAIGQLARSFIESGVIQGVNRSSEGEVDVGGDGQSERTGEQLGTSGARNGVLLPRTHTLAGPSNANSSLGSGIAPAQAKQLEDAQQSSGHHVYTPYRMDAPVETTEALAFAISTPGDPSGQFYDICSRKRGYEDWTTRHVTLEEAITAGRISARWAAQRGRQWGTDSPIYMNRVLGEFADSTEGGVIPLSWVLLAEQRWMEHQASGWANLGAMSKRVLGCDVARMGEDKTVLAQRHALVIRNLHVFSKLPLTSIAGYVAVIGKGHLINIEVDGGYGASVYDMLVEDNVPLVYPVTSGGSTSMRDRSGELGFRDVRSAMWWNLRELLDPDQGVDIALPPIEQLRADLVAPKWQMLRGGIIALEEKKYTKMRLGRSTDYGDSVCLSFWEAATGGGVVF